MFKIGNVEIKNKVVLAPMAGISNPAYIKICEDMGASYAVTELISAEAIIRNNKKTFDMLNGLDMINIPVAIQIFGSNPDTMASAAKILCDKFKVSIIDINMGCPVPKVAVKSDAGSGLLKNPIKVYEIVNKVVNSVNVPVSVKIRSGWDNNSINAKEIAQVIEKAGASCITVHPRTRMQGYSGVANWDIIKEVKESVNIPVIGNGDIKSYKDALNMINSTNCDAVMIGRKALGNPWIIKECVDYLEFGMTPSLVKESERIDMIKKHLNLLIQTKGDKTAVLELRTSLSNYLKGLSNTKELKEKLFKAKNSNEIIKILDEYGD